MAHITHEQRYIIFELLQKGKSQKEISLAINKDKSVISREIKRNKDSRNNIYKANLAETKYRKRLKEKKKRSDFTKEKQHKIDLLLKQKYSPEQIKGICANEGVKMVSIERIYQYIWNDKKKGGNLYKNLRRTGKKYNKRKHVKSSRGIIANRRGIEERPQIVEEKVRFGDLEIDTIVGLHQKSALVTINDRLTGYVWIRKLLFKQAEYLKAATIQALEPFRGMIKTITSDNGKEFAEHEEIAKKLGIDFFFAKPYHSWQRGANENLNGLIRQYFPKGTDFNQVSEEQVKYVQNQLNNRPRKRYNFLAPVQVIVQKLNQVAFIT